MKCPSDCNQNTTIFVIFAFSFFLCLIHQVLCKRAIANLSIVNDGFTVPKMLSSYRATPKRYYDHTFVTPELVIYSSSYWNRNPSYMSMFIRRTNEFRDTNSKFAAHVEGILTGESINMSQFVSDRNDFEKAARSYGYYAIQYLTKIVKAPANYAQGKIDIFNNFYRMNTLVYTALQNNIESTLQFLEEVNIVWDEMRKLRDAYVEYVENSSLYKSNLALLFTSDTIKGYVNIMKQFFEEVSTRSVVAKTRLQQSIGTAVALVTNMKEEVTMYGYYKALYEDIINPENQYDADLLIVLRQLVHKSKSWVLDHWGELNLYLNADILVVDLAANISQELSNLERDLDISSNIGQLDNQFFDVITDIQNDMQKFIDGNEIGDKFYQ